MLDHGIGGGRPGQLECSIMASGVGIDQRSIEPEIIHQTILARHLRDANGDHRGADMR
jgi:hypothetical protein